MEEVGVGHAQESGIISPTKASVSSSWSMLGGLVMVERTFVRIEKEYAKVNGMSAMLQLNEEAIRMNLRKTSTRSDQQPALVRALEKRR